MEPIKLSELFFNNILELPIWVRQVLYSKTKENLEQSFKNYLSILNPDGLVQDVIPALTFRGKHAIETSTPELKQEDLIFITCANKNYTIFDIAITNFWSFEMCCKIYVKLLKGEYIKPAESVISLSLLEYLSGNIKTGDILKRLGIVTVIQIEQALTIQKDNKENGINKKIADIMIELGHIKQSDVDILLKLKEDSKKHFVMSMGLTTIKTNDEMIRQDMFYNIQREYKRVVQENNILKSKLKKLLGI